MNRERIARFTWVAVALWFAAKTMWLLPWLHRTGHAETAIALVQEDGVYETAGAWCCAVAGTLAVARLLSRCGFNGNTFSAMPSIDRASAKLALVSFAILSLLMFGEELSWGQRWFGFATPETIRGVNTQAEFNLHNLRLFHPELENNWLKGAWFWSLVAMLGFAPLVLAAWPVGRGKLGALGISLAGPATALAAIVGAGSYVVQIVVAREAHHPFAAHDAGEAVETLLEGCWLGWGIVWLGRGAGATLGRRLAAPVAIFGLLVSGMALIEAVDAPTRSFDRLAWQRLIDEWLARDEPDRAEAALGALTSDNADDAAAWAQWGAVRLSRGDVAGADARLRRALAIDDSSAGAHYHLGVALIEQQRWDEAEAEFGRALEIVPEFGQAKAGLALAKARGATGRK